MWSVSFFGQVFADLERISRRNIVETELWPYFFWGLSSSGVDTFDFALGYMIEEILPFLLVLPSVFYNRTHRRMSRIDLLELMSS